MEVIENPKYAKPTEVDYVTFAFPTQVIGDYLPLVEEIPKEFDMYKPDPVVAKHWVDLANGIFFGAFRELWYSEREGIDLHLAQRHISVVLRSFQPKHEHKVAGVAYLMSLWFSAVATSDGKEVKVWRSEGVEVMRRSEFMELAKGG